MNFAKILKAAFFYRTTPVAAFVKVFFNLSMVHDLSKEHLKNTYQSTYFWKLLFSFRPGVS